MLGSEAHRHIIYSNLILYQRSRSLFAGKQRVKNVKGALKGRKKKVLEAFEVEKHGLLYI